MANEPYRTEPPTSSAPIGLGPGDGVIRADLVCARCGSQLRGCRRGDPCPGCGVAVGEEMRERETGLSTTASATSPEEEPRRCVRCDYDLRGLARTGRCPECGTPITSVGASAAFEEPLSRMPMPVILQFRSACWLASAVAFTAIIALAWTMLGAGHPALVALAQTAIAAAWVLAAWKLLPALSIRQGVVRGFTDSSALRRAARLLQVAWPLAAACGLIASLLPSAAWLPPAVPAALAKVFILIGLAGLACLAIMLSRLAEWTRDDLAERAFDFSLWGLILGGPPLLVADLISLFDMIVAAGGRLSLLIPVVLLLLWLSALLAFPLALYSLTMSVTLSVQHAHEYAAWMRRKRDRAESENRSLSDRLTAMDQPTRRDAGR